MRRLQANLAYLAAIADKSHKPGAQAPTHPAILTPPPLVPKPASTISPSAITESKKEDGEDQKDTIPIEDRGERIETLKTQYKKLQEMFPDVDPKKEVSVQQANAAAKSQQTGTPQQAGQVVDVNAQQKLQNDQFRQKMMQQAQAQARAQAQGQQAR